jgi:hypothetical protein
MSRTISIICRAAFFWGLSSDGKSNAGAAGPHHGRRRRLPAPGRRGLHVKVTALHAEGTSELLHRLDNLRLRHVFRNTCRFCGLQAAPPRPVPLCPAAGSCARAAGANSPVVARMTMET